MVPLGPCSRLCSYPCVFFGEESCACLPNNYLFSTSNLFCMVKWPWCSMLILYSSWLILSHWLAGIFVNKQISPFLLDNRGVNKNLKIFQKSTNFQVRTSWTSIPRTSAIFEHNSAWVFYKLPTKVSGSISFFFSCGFCVTSLPVPRVFFRRGPVFVFLITKFFLQSTSYFFKVK